MKTFFLIIFILSTLLTGADIVGDKRLRDWEERIRRFAESLKLLPTTNIREIIDRSKKLSIPRWDDFFAKMLFWVGAGIGILIMLVLFIYPFIPAFEAFIDHNIFMISWYALILVIAVIFANIVRVLMEIIARFFLGVTMGCTLVSVMVLSTALWVVIQIYSIADNFSRKNKLKSTLYFIGITIGVLGLVVQYLLE